MPEETIEETIARERAEQLTYPTPVLQTAPPTLEGLHAFLLALRASAYVSALTTAKMIDAWLEKYPLPEELAAREAREREEREALETREEREEREAREREERDREVAAA